MTDSALHPMTVVSVRQQGEQESLLVLRDDMGRVLDIPIGVCETLAIQLATTGVVVGRPFTHDLFLIIAEELDASVDHVVIDDYSKGTFYARIILNTPDGATLHLDCRPSDAIAVALRASAPVLAADAVIRRQGHE